MLRVLLNLLRSMSGDSESRKRNLPRCPRRSGHVAICLEENLLVWGGYTDSYDGDEKYLPPADLWIYDSEMNFWTSRQCNGKCPPGTSGACGLFIAPFLYVIGGHTDNGHVGHVYRLNLVTLVWEHVHILSPGMSPRDKFTALAYKHKIFCFGGYGRAARNYFPSALCDYGSFEADRSEHAFSTCWNNQLLILDTDLTTWSNPQCRGIPPATRAAHAAALVDDKMYIFGGRHVQERLNDLHCLDVGTMTWSGELATTGLQPCGRSWHSLTKLYHNHLFLYGGFTNQERALDDAWVLSLSAMQWTEVNQSSGYPRLWHTACVTQSKNILIFGGCSNNILSHEHQSVFTGQVIRFEVQPKRLDRLCLEAVFTNRRRTASEWKWLPLPLQRWLEMRSKIEKDWQDLDPVYANLLGPHSVNGFCSVPRTLTYQ